MCRTGGRRCTGSTHNGHATQITRQRISRARRALRTATAAGDPTVIDTARKRLTDARAAHTAAKENTMSHNETPDQTGDGTGPEDNAANPKPTARRPLTEDEQAFLDTAKQWQQSWEGNNPNGNTTADQHGIGTVHGNIGRVIIGGDGPIIANHTFGRDRTPRGGTGTTGAAEPVTGGLSDKPQADNATTTTFDTPDGQVTNTVHGQNLGQ
jgi:hypothetical protein